MHEAERGRPSYVWRAGQDRRLALVTAWASVPGARLLDVGCGVGLYASRLARDGAWVVGSEVEWPRARTARTNLDRVTAARGEQLPFPDGAFDVVLLHEVLEHVTDDRRTVEETARVLADGGRMVVFVPNRWWPFETHGIYWRSRYLFGNAPLVNYLPDPFRNRLVPHARAYTGSGLLDLIAGSPLRVVHHDQVFPGFDRLAVTRPRTAAIARRACGLVARTPGRATGLSHLLVAERLPRYEG